MLKNTKVNQFVSDTYCDTEIGYEAVTLTRVWQSSDRVPNLTTPGNLNHISRTRVDYFTY